jgi:hypothetical protein
MWTGWWVWCHNLPNHPQKNLLEIKSFSSVKRIFNIFAAMMTRQVMLVYKDWPVCFE